MDQAFAPSDALAAIDRSRAQLVAASDTPPLRHLAFAALMGTLVAAPAIPVAPLRMGVFALLLVGVALIVQWDRRRTGMFVNGYRAGATRWVTFAILAVCLGLYGVSNWLALGRHLVWPSLALGIAATAIAYMGSLWWCRVFRREMGVA